MHNSLCCYITHNLQRHAQARADIFASNRLSWESSQELSPRHYESGDLQSHIAESTSFRVGEAPKSTRKIGISN